MFYLFYLLPTVYVGGDLYSKYWSNAEFWIKNLEGDLSAHSYMISSIPVTKNIHVW